MLTKQKLGSIGCSCGCVVFSLSARQTIEEQLLPGVISVQEILECVSCKEKMILEKIASKIETNTDVVLFRLKELKGAFC